MSIANDSDLPPGWRWVQPDELAGVGRHTIGIGPFGSDLKVSDYTQTGIPLVFVRNIRAGEFLPPDQPHVSLEKAAQLAAHTVLPGDVLITKMGEPPGDAALYPSSLIGQARMTADCIRLRVNPLIASSKFVVYATRSQRFREQVIEATKGVAQKKISLERYRAMRYPIPPIEEQARIVAAIETQFTRLDSAVATLERVRANLKRAHASILKAAVEGRLVPTEAALARAEGRPYEPASVLLTRILEERKARWPKGKKYVAPAQPDKINGHDLPEGWARTTFGAVCTIRGGYAFKSSDYLEDAGGVALIRQSDLRSGHVSVETSKRVPAELWSTLGDQYGLRRGDFLVGLSGSLSSVSEYCSEEPALQNQRTGLLQASTVIDRRFALIVYRALVPQIEAASKGVAVQNVAPRDIEGLPIKLPPLTEQNRIVADAERRMSLLDNLTDMVELNLARCARLRQSILKRAFEGKLVPQNPADEPATVLLDRLQKAAKDLSL